MEDTIEMAFNTEKGLEDTMNPFVSWANNIYEESQNHIEEGMGINPFLFTFNNSIIKEGNTTSAFVEWYNGSIIWLRKTNKIVSSS